MADTLTDAHHQAQAARDAGHDALADDVAAAIRRRYRGAMRAGISDNTTRAGLLARDALTLAQRFRDHEDMILRFVVDLAVASATAAGQPGPGCSREIAAVISRK